MTFSIPKNVGDMKVEWRQFESDLFKAPFSALPKFNPQKEKRELLVLRNEIRVDFISRLPNNPE